MSITPYEFLSIIQASEGAEQSALSGGYSYPKLLERVRSQIAEKHSHELAGALESAEAAKTLKILILKYCASELAGQDFDRDALVEKVYQDMAGLGMSYWNLASMQRRAICLPYRILSLKCTRSAFGMSAGITLACRSSGAPKKAAIPKMSRS